MKIIRNDPPSIMIGSCYHPKEVVIDEFDGVGTGKPGKYRFKRCITCGMDRYELLEDMRAIESQKEG